MQVIPAINAPDFETAKKLITIASGFSDWVHIDVGDGAFSSIKTWDKPEEFRIMNQELGIREMEAHLMVVDPLNCAEAWLLAGVERLIIHLETVNEQQVGRLLDLCKKYNADLMLSIAPEIPVEKFWPYIDRVSYFQILAVDPGRAGQGFQPIVLEKIKLLRQKAPNAKIEVDGGINLETAKVIKEAGADIIVSASYIFDSSDPEIAYRKLQNI